MKVVLDRWWLRRALWPWCALRSHRPRFWLTRTINGAPFDEVSRCSCGLSEHHSPVDERGTVLVEWMLGFVFILLPVVGLGSAAVNWPDRLNAANTAAYEAAKTVLATGDEGAATARAQDVWTSHGYADMITVSYDGDLAERGGTIRATVTITLPVTHFLGAGDAGGASWSTHHDERVPDYRSAA